MAQSLNIQPESRILLTNLSCRGSTLRANSLAAFFAGSPDPFTGGASIMVKKELITCGSVVIVGIMVAGISMAWQQAAAGKSSDMNEDVKKGQETPTREEPSKARE